MTGDCQFSEQGMTLLYYSILTGKCFNKESSQIIKVVVITKMDDLIFFWGFYFSCTIIDTI